MHNMYNIFHNYMLRPILGQLQVVSYSLKSEVTWSGYLTLQAIRNNLKMA